MRRPVLISSLVLLFALSAEAEPVPDGALAQGCRPGPAAGRASGQGARGFQLGLCDTEGSRADSDNDGLSDEYEIVVSRTDPLVADVSETERRFAILPEPLHFDLVRGLAARRGELEVNSLFRRRARGGEPLEWAPEIEYAFADGMALELELPISGTHIEAIKAAFQARLPAPENPVFIHGFQVIAEWLLDRPVVEATGLHLLALALSDRWSILMMTGARLEYGEDASPKPELLLNPSVFFRAGARLVAGIETNLALASRQGTKGLVLPQLHWEPVNHLRIQLGAGPKWSRGEVELELVGRIVVEI